MKLEDYLSSLPIQYNEMMLEQFNQYYQILLEWNTLMNLTTIIAYEDVVKKHFIDSLSIIQLYPELFKRESIRLIDVGTGAGFPGIPLKIVFPHMDIVLLDSLNKRVLFLKHLIQKLELNKIEAVHLRAEDAAHDMRYREAFDICVSRAVAKLNTLSEYCIPFIKKDGIFAAYKTENSMEEIYASEKAIHILSGQIEDKRGYKIDDNKSDRIIIKIRKVNHTSKVYPRLGAKPSKNPL